MEVLEAIKTVLAVREFQNREVSRETITEIIEAARLTGSSMNGQPWHFIIVENRNSLIELGKLVSSGPYNSQAAFAVAVGIDKHSEYGISDASRAIQSMVLAAWSVGVGSNWTGWKGMKNVASFLNVPESIDIIAVLPFGYPKNGKVSGIKRRKSTSEIAYSEKFGAPFK